jgi:hypothetical protein
VAVAAWCLLATSGGARAGHYGPAVYSSTNGKVTITPPIPGSPFAYTVTQYGYGGGYGGGGQVDCTGPITATFTWVPAWDGEPPPATVIVAETCAATWQGYNVGPPPTGACDNGLNSGSVDLGPILGIPSPPFTTRWYTSSGTRYSIVAGGQQIVRTCTPSAQASSPIYAAASVWYSCSATPVQVNLAGVKWKDADHTWNILIGQGCTAALSAGTYSLANYSWAISGDTFKSYVAHGYYTGAQAHAYLLDASDLAAAAPHWYWRSAGDSMSDCSVEFVAGYADA